MLVVFRVKSRCKHYMIDQTRSGKFVIVGMPQVYKSLKEMVNVHKKVQGTVQTRVCLFAPGKVGNQNGSDVEVQSNCTRELYEYRPVLYYFKCCSLRISIRGVPVTRFL